MSGQDTVEGNESVRHSAKTDYEQTKCLGNYKGSGLPQLDHWEVVIVRTSNKKFFTHSTVVNSPKNVIFLGQTEGNFSVLQTVTRDTHCRPTSTHHRPTDDIFPVREKSLYAIVMRDDIINPDKTCKGNGSTGDLPQTQPLETGSSN